MWPVRPGLSFEGGTIDDVEIDEPVAVVVEEARTRSRAFYDVFLVGASRDILDPNAQGFRHVLEANRGFRAGLPKVWERDTLPRRLRYSGRRIY